MEKISLSERSYLLVQKNAVKLSAEQFSELWSLKPETRGHVILYGKKMTIPRYQRLYGAASYSFSGVTVPSEPLSSETPGHSILQNLLDFVNEVEERQYNGMLVNFYPLGTDYIGPHADDEKDLVEDAPIYSFSFGATRTFRFHPMAGGKKVLDLELEDGMLVAMCGDCQKEFKHSVPVRKTCKEPRINITIRAFN